MPFCRVVYYYTACKRGQVSSFLIRLPFTFLSLVSAGVQAANAGCCKARLSVLVLARVPAY